MELSFKLLQKRFTRLYYKFVREVFTWNKYKLTAEIYVCYMQRHYLPFLLYVKVWLVANILFLYFLIILSNY